MPFLPHSQERRSTKGKYQQQHFYNTIRILQAGCPSCHSAKSVGALKASINNIKLKFVNEIKYFGVCVCVLQQPDVLRLVLVI